MFIFRVTLNPPPRQTRGGVTPVITTPGPLAIPQTGPTAPAPLPPRGLARFVRLDTLAGQFTTLVLAAVILAVAGLVISYLVLTGIEKSYKDVVNNSSPSIIAAENLNQAFQNADAAAANYQLYSRVDVNSPDFDPKVYGDSNSQATCKNGLRNCAWQSFLNSRQQINDAIFKARANITYKGEADAINAISVRFLDYVGQINVMKAELDAGHRETALAAYKAAHDILVGNLNNVTLNAGRSPEEQLKLNNWVDDKGNSFDTNQAYLGIEANAHKLAETNIRALNTAYNAETNSITFGTVLVLIFGVLLSASLVLLSIRYALVTHRVINPGYALALVGAITLTVLLLTTLVKAKDDYKTVGSDSFSSIETVAEARQLVADANADASRLLLSPEGPGLDSTNPGLTTDVRQAFSKQTLTKNFDTKQALITNTLVTAWKDVTYYPDETNALCKISQNLYPANQFTQGLCATSSFARPDYLNAANQARDRFNSNLLASAITDITLTNNDKVTGNLSLSEPFSRLDNALLELSKVNERYFDQSTCNAIGGRGEFGQSCNGTGYLPTLQVGVLIVFPLIALAAVGGFLFARRRF